MFSIWFKSACFILSFAILMLTVSCERQVVEIESFDGLGNKPGGNMRMKHQAEVHLTDGQIVHYPSGFEAVSDTIITTGYSLDPATADTIFVNDLPLQEISSIEKTRYEFTVTAKIILSTVVGTIIFSRLLAIMLGGISATGG